MATHSYAKKANKASSRSHLRAIPGGRNAGLEEGRSEVGQLLSGRVSRAPKPKRGRKREVPPQPLPKEIQALANVYAAQKTLEKELGFKGKFAEQKVKDYCVREYVHRFATQERKPPSLDFTADHAHFKFIMTMRTTLTPEKIDYLSSRNIAIDKYTELRGIRVNYDAIRQHGLEKKLRSALESMNVAKGVLEEVFRPEVELKDGFYERFYDVLRDSLQQGEDLEDKMLETLNALGPANQVRGLEAVGLTVKQCFELVNETEIDPEAEDVA